MKRTCLFKRYDEDKKINFHTHTHTYIPLKLGSEPLGTGPLKLMQ